MKRLAIIIPAYKSKFLRQTLDSLVNQTNQNFKWLVFFDVQTPKEYREIVVNYVRDYNNFIPLFIDGMKSFNQELIKYISNCERNIL